uniref:Uncharacterized protein n=1 Tax=Oryza brachyantha TaxID=4533 RepID=J3LVY7_ORYBR
MDDKPPSTTTESSYAESPTPTLTTHTTPDHDDKICDLPEEFCLSGPPTPSSLNPFLLPASMEEDGMIYAGHLG